MQNVTRPRSSAGAILLALLLLPLAACAPARTGAPPAPAAAATDAADTDAAETDAVAAELDVLFLGDDALHRPVERLRDVASPMLDRGITLHFTTDTADLNPTTLARYDALLIYSNHEHLAPHQERALLDYVAGGGGLVALHSASGSFLNSPAYLALVGGQFRSHRTGVFSTRIAHPEHEIMRGFDGFESWDETYVHRNHNEENRTVLAYREDEPWTWVRTHGDGRVFYTAWGHDGRTWTNPGFQDLLERGIRWAAGQDVQQALANRTIDNPFEYAVLDVPFPPPYEVRLEYEREEGRPMDRGANYPLFYEHQQPLSPTEAIERMIVPAGFHVELFASEPDIVNPIDMTWDERGRLWVIESLEYPYPRQLWPDGGGKDRITIVEDTDGDGRADEFTVFADGLNIPTSLTFANGGVIVHQAPQTLFLKDTDGDGRADVREVLFEGWSQSDTHAGPSHLRYGLDNWIWGVQGYSGFEGTIGGEDHAFRMGVYRFRKDGSELEFLRRTNNNTWGLGFNERGEAFISTANGNPSTYLPFPQQLSERLPELEPELTERIADTDRIIMLNNKFRQVDFVGAFTAAAGHGVYTARRWPREYWNRVAFVSEPTGRIVTEFEIDPAGSSYRARYTRNLVASDDQWFAPVVAEVGPDGHVWIADWYNYILQHNAESNRQRAVAGNAYASPLRDRHHGRIYRIVYDGAPAQPAMSLEGASPEQLVATLAHDNMLWRLHAQRLLVERGQTDVVPALLALVADESVDEIGLNVGAVHALWTLHGLGQLGGQNTQALNAARAALRHPSAAVRANAVQVLPQATPSVQAILSSGVLNDDDARVRLRALVALADMPPSDDAGRAVYALLAQPASMEDTWIRRAGAFAAAAHSRGFLAAADEAGMIARVNAQTAPQNVLPNAGFENVADRQPQGWTTRVRSGTPELAVESDGRNGGRAVVIRAAEGAEASWVAPGIPLNARTQYRLSGWIRAARIERGEGRGALLTLSGVPGALGRTESVTEAGDWVYRERVFTTTSPDTAAVNLTLGGGDPSAGEVWFDDVALVELGPEPGSTLESIVGLVMQRAPASVAAQTATPAAAADIVLEVGVVPEELRFDRTELRVGAGQRVSIVFTNTDNMEHNMLVIRPGTIEQVGRLADALMTPAGRAQQYVPDSPDVIVNTPILQPTERYTLTFTAPTEPGRYTFVCTIPGHWRVMQGTLIVE